MCFTTAAVNTQLSLWIMLSLIRVPNLFLCFHDVIGIDFAALWMLNLLPTFTLHRRTIDLILKQLIRAFYPILILSSHSLPVSRLFMPSTPRTTNMRKKLSLWKKPTRTRYGHSRTPNTYEPQWHVEKVTYYLLAENLGEVTFSWGFSSPDSVQSEEWLLCQMVAGL